MFCWISGCEWCLGGRGGPGFGLMRVEEFPRKRWKPEIRIWNPVLYSTFYRIALTEEFETC